MNECWERNINGGSGRNFAAAHFFPWSFQNRFYLMTFLICRTRETDQLRSGLWVKEEMAKWQSSRRLKIIPELEQTLVKRSENHENVDTFKRMGTHFKMIINLPFPDVQPMIMGTIGRNFRRPHCCSDVSFLLQMNENPSSNFSMCMSYGEYRIWYHEQREEYISVSKHSSSYIICSRGRCC